MRTSHFLQNMGNQVEKIEDGWKIYKDEGVSGRLPFEERPAGRKLLDDIQKGKLTEIVVLRIDRLGRSTSNILQSIKTIHSFGIGIRSINEGLTTLVDGKETPMSVLLVNLLSTLSEFQYLQTREKTLAGIQRCKLEGKFKGRKLGSVERLEKFLQKPKVSKIKLMLDQGMSIRNICSVVECSPNYIYKVKDRLLSA